MHYNYLIIGGGVSGTVAAETIRAKDANLTIAILSEEKNYLYSRVQIPYYIKGLKKREEIFLRSDVDYAQNKIDLLMGKEALELVPGSKKLTCSDGVTYTYDKLLITTGGKPKKLGVHKNELSMHTIEDADALINSIQPGKKAVVVGSGFIALELVGAFLHLGLKTTLYLSPKGFWGGFLSPELSAMITKSLIERGVLIKTVAITEDDQKDIDSGAAILGTGVGIETAQDFFSSAGLTFDNGIVCDKFLQTSVPDVYAAGDVAKFYSTKLERHVRYGNWTNALLSAKIAGQNMVINSASENPTAFDSLSAYSIKTGDLGMVFLGYTALDDNVKTYVKKYSDKEAAQFYIKNGKLDGCVLINRAQDRPSLQKAIEQREEFVID